MGARMQTEDEAQLFEMLSGVERPGRYIGGEWNEIVKDHRDLDLTFALAFPDLYESACPTWDFVSCIR